MVCAIPVDVFGHVLVCPGSEARRVGASSAHRFSGGEKSFEIVFATPHGSHVGGKFPGLLDSRVTKCVKLAISLRTDTGRETFSGESHWRRIPSLDKSWTAFCSEYHAFLFWRVRRHA